MERILNSWAGLASHYIGICFDFSKPYINNENKDFDPYVRFVMAQLYIDCHLSSESVLILIKNGKPWDADMLVRSVLEGTLKFLYILDGEKEANLKKAYEYWKVIPSFHGIRHSNRADAIIKAAEGSDHFNIKPFQDLLLDEDDISEIRKRYSKVERKNLESAWSFSGMCKVFSQSENPLFRQFQHFAHNYGMSSHLLHKDGIGTGMVWNRYQRTDNEQHILHLSHSSRMVSDICTFADLRLMMLFRLCNQPLDKIFELREDFDELLFQELKKAQQQFHDVIYADEEDELG